jgi:hypothetical protein
MTPEEEPMTDPRRPIRELMTEAFEAGVIIEGHVPGVGLVVRLPRPYTPEHVALADALGARSDEAADALVGDVAAALLAELEAEGLA